MRYINPERTAILRDDGATVPCDPANADYQRILASGLGIAPYARFASLDEAKASKLADLSAIRSRAEQAFTFAGQPIRLDESTQFRIASALQYLTLSGETGADWQARRGVFVTLSKAQLEAMAVAAGVHVQACFARAKALTNSINAASTIAEIEAIDLTQGWP